MSLTTMRVLVLKNRPLKHPWEATTLNILKEAQPWLKVGMVILVISLPGKDMLSHNQSALKYVGKAQWCL